MRDRCARYADEDGSRMTNDSSECGSVERQARNLCAELERQLRAGEAVSAEAMLAANAQVAANADLAIDLIYTEFAVRDELGQPADVERWYQSFPNWRDRLERLFHVHEHLNDEESLAALSQPSGWPGEMDFSQGIALVGRRFGGYELLEEIGHGGMGIVFRARHVEHGSVVAVKLIRSGIHARTSELARFRKEAQAAARLQHPNIVQILEVGEQEGWPYLVLELVAGGNLEGRLAAMNFPIRSAARLLETVARAVQFAHERGIVHRDLKPANILLSASESIDTVWFDSANPSTNKSSFDGSIDAFCPKITDFGLAKRFDDESSQTKTGAILGTPSYMSPEQCSGKSKEVGAASDVYALGAILYEVLTGRPPFRCETVLETLEQIRTQDPTPPSRIQPNTPRDLETVCLKCLEKEPRKRYTTASDFADELRRYANGEPVRARPNMTLTRIVKWVRRRPAISGLFAAVIVVTLLGFAGVFWQWQRAENRGDQLATALATARRATANAIAERERAESSIYFQRIGLAHQQWVGLNPGAANTILDECAFARRHWEWRYLKRLCNVELFSRRISGDPITSVAISPDGMRVAAVTGVWHTGDPGSLEVWNLGSRGVAFKGTTYSGPVMRVSISPNGRWIATGGATWAPNRTGEVKIWDTQSGQEQSTIPKRIGNTFAIAFSPDSQRIAFGGLDRQVRVCDLASGRELFALPHQDKDSGHRDTVFCVEFSPDGSLLASAGRDGSVIVWDAATGRKILAFPRTVDIRCISFSPDGRRLAAGSWDTSARIYDVKTGEELLRYTGHSSPVVGAAFCPDGRLIATSDFEGLVRIWNAYSGRTTQVIRAHVGTANAVAFHPDGWMLASAGRDGLAKFWDMSCGFENRSLGSSFGNVVSQIAFSPDGLSLAAAGGMRRGVRGNSARVWRVQSNAPPTVLEGHKAGVTGVAFHPGGQYLATSSDDMTIRLWELGSGTSRATMPAHTHPILAVAISPDGHTMLSAAADGQLKSWGLTLHNDNGGEITTNAAVSVSEGWSQSFNDGPIVRVAILPNGKRFGALTGSGRLFFGDCESGHSVAVLPNAAAVNSFALSGDGQSLATGDKDGLIQIWETSALFRSGDSKPLQELRGHQFAIADLAFSGDARRLVSGGTDRTLRIWDMETAQTVLTFREPTDAVSAVAMRPDDLLLASAGTEIRLWDAPLQETTSTAKIRDSSAEWIRNWHDQQAQVCAQESNWFGAAFHLNREIESGAATASMFARRSTALAELDRPEAAYADAQRAIELGADDWWLWQQLGFLALIRGDQSEYRRVCARLLDRFGATSDPSIANSIAWTCATAPDAVSDPQEVVALIERALAARPNNQAYLNTLGAALYRAGQFDRAVDRLNESIRIEGRGGVVEDWLLLAMAHGRAGRHAETMQWLEKSRKWFASPDRTDPKNSANRTIVWGARLSQQLLLQEAESIVRQAH